MEAWSEFKIMLPVAEASSGRLQLQEAGTLNNL